MADHAGQENDVFLYVGQQEVPRDVTHVRIDESVRIIPQDAFYGRRYLVSVEMHNGVDEIWTRAFCNCISLRSIRLTGVIIIQESAFNGCRNLDVDMEFGGKLDIIGREAFLHCDCLKNIVLRNVSVIGYRAFAGCKQLNDVECGERLVRIEGMAFLRCPALRRIVIPLKRDMVGFYDYAFNCLELSTVELVGGIHKTVSSLHLESWKSQINQLIDRINRFLPTVPAGSKTTFIQDWIVSVYRRLNQCKNDHYKLLKEATTLLELALWKAILEEENEDNSSEAKPKKKAKIDHKNARKQRRITSGAAMSIVIKNVLPFLKLEE